MRSSTNLYFGSVRYGTGALMWGLKFVVVLILVNGWLCLGCLEEERVALLQLKASINFPSGDSLQPWSEETETDCCQWNGVECSATTGRVVKLSLNYTRQSWIQGDWYLNASKFLPFDDLRVLHLPHNQIVGCVANEGFERLCRLKKLEVLDLSGNIFNNSVLSSLRGLSSLKSLNLTSNDLTGSIPIQELDGLSNLEELDISANMVDSFTVPEGIRSASKLKVLYLNEVNFSAGNLLESLGHLTSLKTLYFQNGNLEGAIIPQNMNNRSNLEELVMDYSSISNDFLHSKLGMNSLKVLSMYSCGFNGTLPAQGWCNLKNVEELDLSKNGFEGTLPPCFGNLTSLRVLDLSYNQFSGNVASSPLPTLTSLEYLSLSNNFFRIPVSFQSFSNYSNLKVLMSDNNKLVQDNMPQSWVPNFQLQLFSFSNCTSKELEVESPNFLRYQHDLRIVDLSHNNFKGNLPSWLLENNTRLKELNLRDDSFVGAFELPSHPNSGILRIDISKNYITGQIPANATSVFPNLRALNTSRNALEGKIPSSLGDMKSLSVLDLSNNNLSGVIPEHLAMSCSSLIFLRLSNNKLEGRIPRNMNLPRLEYLYLDGNYFSGTIPRALSNLSLWVLDISSNHLSGKLPRRIGNLSTAVEIVIANNHLQGPIPTEFCKLDSLLLLDLSENNLSGLIPSCFNPSNIKCVHLYGNALGGAMTRAFYKSSSLETLDLRDNKFSGRIPNWIGTLSALSILLLKGNQFRGTIPSQICELKQLRMLDLSQNNLSGLIPGCLSNISFKAASQKSLPSTDCIGSSSPNEGSSSCTERKKLKDIVKDMEEHTNAVKCPLPDSSKLAVFTTKSRSYTYKGGIVNYMSGIDLSCNFLGGEIPPELGNLSEVRVLNFSHNDLFGSIPATFPNLKNMESLDLSYNKLNGRIPPQLTELSFIAVFSVAYNNLSGATPEQKAQFATFEERSYEGNPLLCGPPLSRSCEKNQSPSVPEKNWSLEEEKNDGLVDMEVFGASFAASYVVVLISIGVVFYINPYWRRAWFFIVEEFMISSYYFCKDNFLKLLKF